MDIAIFITLLIITYKSSKSLSDSSEIFKEFNVSRVLSVLVFIYPLGPLLLIFGSMQPHILLYLLVAACFLPQLVIARKQINALNLLGTNRVKGATDALSLAWLGAIIGLIYLAVVLIMIFSISSVATSNHY